MPKKFKIGSLCVPSALLILNRIVNGSILFIPLWLIDYIFGLPSTLNSRVNACYKRKYEQNMQKKQEGQRCPKRRVAQAAIRLATAVITFRNKERNVRSPRNLKLVI